MLEGRNFDKWKTKYDVMEWYIYGVQKAYEQIEGQVSLFDGDYYDRFADYTYIQSPAAARELLLDGI